MNKQSLLHLKKRNVQFHKRLTSMLVMFKTSVVFIKTNQMTISFHFFSFSAKLVQVNIFLIKVYLVFVMIPLLPHYACSGTNSTGVCMHKRFIIMRRSMKQRQLPKQKVWFSPCSLQGDCSVVECMLSLVEIYII